MSKGRDDNIDWSNHWINENPPDRKDFHDANAFDYMYGFLPPPTFDVLELGCGIGVWATNWILHGANYSGLDANDDAIDIARLRHPELHFYHTPAEDMSFLEKFDVIFTHTFLQHTNIATKEKVFPRIYRALRANGLLVIQENCDANSETFFTRERWIWYVKRFGFEFLVDTPRGDQRNGMVFRKANNPFDLSHAKLAL